MRSITLISALAAALLLLSSSDALAAGGWTWPVRGPVITPYRNGANPYAAGQHRGIDVGAPVGTRVVAAVGGTVTFVGVVGSAGLTVSERSADGRFDLSYLHLSSATVRRGETVTAGAALGAVGTSGRRSAAAPHLHFGVRDAGRRSAYRDPLDFLAGPPAGNAPEAAPAPVPVAHPATAEPAPSAMPGREPAPAIPGTARVPRVLPGGAPLPLPWRGHSPRALPALGDRRQSTVGARRHLEAHRAQHGGARPSAAHPVWRGPHGAPPRHVPAHATPAIGPRRGGSRRHGGGIDFGWLAACLGLVATATALGRPDAARKLALRGRARFGALLARQ